MLALLLLTSNLLRLTEPVGKCAAPAQKQPDHGTGAVYVYESSDDDLGRDDDWGNDICGGGKNKHTHVRNDTSWQEYAGWCICPEGSFCLGSGCNITAPRNLWNPDEVSCPPQKKKKT